MNKIKITKDAIQYLSSSLRIDDEEAEEHLITAISMCQFSESNSGHLLDDNKRLKQWLGVVLDQVDYTSGACSVTEMVGAVLDRNVILNARAALSRERAG